MLCVDLGRFAALWSALERSEWQWDVMLRVFVPTIRYRRFCLSIDNAGYFSYASINKYLDFLLGFLSPASIFMEMKNSIFFFWLLEVAGKKWFSHAAESLKGNL